MMASQSGSLISKLVYAILLLLALGFSAKGCSHDCICEEDRAKCTRKSDPFPLDLDPKTKKISIKYTGEADFHLTASMIGHYEQLEELAFDGNLSSIEDLTFATAYNLKKLSISYSRLKSIRYDVFGSNSSLQELHLPRNLFLHSFPIDVFHALKHLVTLDFSYSRNIDVCVQSDTIGERFRMLVSLKYVYFAGIGDKENCKHIGSNFFSPLQNIERLDLSESSFLKGDQTILKPLTNLTALYINNVAPYNSCPSLAKELFLNLGARIGTLHAESWRTNSALGQECTITKETLAGLTQLRYLNYISFKFGDLIFESTLPKGLFQGFTNLRQLNLEWCRITKIANGALEGLHLTDLYLEGNPLGSKEFWGYNLSHTPPTTRYLDLKNCMISNDETFSYNAHYIVQNFPFLTKLDMGWNLLFVLPNFTHSDSNITSSQHITMNFYGNTIRQVRRQEMEDLCKVFPKLEMLDLSNNMISTIEMVCDSVTNFTVKKNALWKNTKVNFASIRKLRNLISLELSDNELTTIPSDLFKNMHHLKTLILIDNEIASLDLDQFIHNPSLNILDMSKNLLQEFHASVFRNVTALQKLFLRTNKISVFDKAFISFVESTPSLRVLRLDDNSFDCSCEQIYFQKWVKQSDQLQHKSSLFCHRPESLKNQTVTGYTQPPFDCYVKWCLIGLGAVVGLVATILVTYRLRWYLAHLRFTALSVAERLVDIKQQDECKYDAMVLFNSKSDQDVNLVKELMIELEGGEYQSINLLQPDGRDNLIYIRVRDDLSGGINYQQCCAVMKQSRKIILVLSNSFLTEPECVSEATFAGGELFSTATLKPERIMILVLEELHEPLTTPVSSLLEETNYINLYKEKRNNVNKMRGVWQKLRRFVSHQKRLPSVNPQGRDGYEPL